MKKLICTFLVCFGLIVATDYVFADFDPESSVVPTSIGDISVIMEDLETGTDRVIYKVIIKDADGNIITEKQGNLVPHLTAGEISAMQSFMAGIRTKAQAFIPAP